MQKKTVVFYHFYEANEEYASNLRYFLELGVIRDVDYIIVISGGCSFSLPVEDNIRYVHTPNQGLDFGAYKLALETIEWSSYKYFIFINCTTRGPFMINYDKSGWPALFTDLLSSDVKLVGTTINVLPAGDINSNNYALFSSRKPPFPHVQTMTFAIDTSSLSLLWEKNFFDFVPDAKSDIISRFEIHLSQIILSQGWNIACLAPDYRNIDYRIITSDPNPTSWSGDPWFPGAYFGRSLHPYETVFFKNNRSIRTIDEMESLSQTQLKLHSRQGQSPVERALASIPTAWSGHKSFARWLVSKIRPSIVIDLGVDFGFSTFCFASAGAGKVYGIDSFQGDDHAGFRDTYGHVTRMAAELEYANVEIIKGFFGEVAASWVKPVDILHIDGRHDYESVREDHEAWAPFVRSGGVVLFHDTCVSQFGVRKYFDELSGPKLNFCHSAGLGVMSDDCTLIKEIATIFSTLVEPESTRL